MLVGILIDDLYIVELKRRLKTAEYLSEELIAELGYRLLVESISV